MYNRKREVFDVIENLFFPSLINNASSDKELVIIDDCSPLEKETRQLVERNLEGLSKFGNVIFKRNDKNKGFAGAFNEGTSLASGKNLFITNDDIYLPEGSVSSLVSTLHESNNYGLVGPIVNARDVWTYQYCKQAPKINSYSKEEIKKIQDFSIFCKERMKGMRIKTDVLSGFCWAADMARVREERGFDEDYKNGSFEDIDLARKMSKKYDIIINPEIFVYHGDLKNNHVSLNQQRIKRHYNELKNTLTFSKKNGYFVTLKHLSKAIYRSTGKDTVSELF
jgi:GT2 family glycosyltransferase